jgi:dipeptide/tripeptide permease
MPETENFNYYGIQILLTVFKRFKINISEIDYNSNPGSYTPW